MKTLLLCILLCASLSAKTLRVHNATSAPVAVSLAGSTVAVVGPATTSEFPWDFTADGIVDGSSQAVSISGVDGGPVLGASTGFPLLENESSLVVDITQSSAVFAVAVSEKRMRAAKERYSQQVALWGFASGFVVGIVLFIFRLSKETFEEAL